jgi:predicted nuclease of predicted toxin-antitoxin system
VKFLADAGISPKTVAALISAGHAATHIRALGMQRADDRDILELARTEGSVVLTFDLDFADLMALGIASTPSVVIFRLSDETPSSVNAKLLPVLLEQRDALAQGALVMVEDSRYRLRRLPILPLT